MRRASMFPIAVAAILLMGCQEKQLVPSVNPPALSVAAAPSPAVSAGSTTQSDPFGQLRPSQRVAIDSQGGAATPPPFDGSVAMGAPSGRTAPPVRSARKQAGSGTSELIIGAKNPGTEETQVIRGKTRSTTTKSSVEIIGSKTRTTTRKGGVEVIGTKTSSRNPKNDGLVISGRSATHARRN